MYINLVDYLVTSAEEAVIAMRAASKAVIAMRADAYKKRLKNIITNLSNKRYDLTVLLNLKLKKNLISIN